jgi:chromosome segregation protein
MRLKSLELVGFKSFVDRTVVQFEEGVTGIVGPNGSGKSNVVDAIRWVMGEQSAKHLRGSAMQDVIFSGSQKRTPMGMASIFLTFDNSDGRAPAEYSNYAEITVGRRLYRSGESEYYINKTPCRLKDIVDLFLGTGTGTKAYSIVEQGQIGLIVSAKPDERRLLIEEAAGISKFKHRRAAAQRKMEATRSNLARLQDIVNELQRQINSLQRQVKKAERYKALTEELCTIELTHAAHQWQGWQGELVAVEERLTRLTEEEALAAAKLSETETQIDEGRVALSEIERELSLAQERAYALQNRIHLLEANIKHKTQEIDDTAQRSQTATQEAKGLEVKRVEWVRELGVANQEKVECDVALASVEEEAGALSAQVEETTRGLNACIETLHETQGTLVEVVEAISAAQSRSDHLDHRIVEIQEEIVQAQAQVKDVDVQLRAVRSQITTEREGLESQQQLSMELTQERGSLEETLQRQSAELQQTTTDLLEQREALHRLESRRNSLEELARNFEGFQEGGRAVLQDVSAGSVTAQVRGSLDEFVVTDSQYEAAVSAVLGEVLQGVVVESHADGAAAIRYLKETAKGRGTFVPQQLRSVDSEPPVVCGDGVIGPLASYVRFTAALTAAGPLLLRGVILVETVEAGIAQWQRHQGRYRFVTLDGDLITEQGIVMGGSRGDQAQHILSRRRELEDLSQQGRTLQTEVDQLEVMQHRAQGRVDHMRAQLDSLSQNRQDAEVDLAHLKKDLDHKEHESRRLTEALASAQTTVRQKEEVIERIAAERGSLGAKLEALRTQREGLTADIDAGRGEEQEFKARSESLTATLHERKAHLASQQERVRGVEREIDRLIKSTAEAKSTIARKSLEVEEGQKQVVKAREEIATNRQELGEAVTEAETRAQRQQTVQQRYQSTLESVREREAQLRDLRRAHEERIEAKHQSEITGTQQRERLIFLEREIQERYHLHLADHASEYLTESYCGDGVDEKIEQMRERVEKLGGVNTDAIEECDELQQRYDFLTKQAGDLEESIEALHKAIHKINRITRERFRTTFAEINERFTQLFPKLFRGGKAELVMTDADHILESGIEIVAQPPGKKLQSVTLLSGGEKALTAVALIFAMFLVRPSPFCLLDEVDAPLDDANIDRFNDLIREMTNFSQFILITHNKRTMELADSLYGVTMEEAGVSKLVSVRLNQESARATKEETAAA